MMCQTRPASTTQPSSPGGQAESPIKAAELEFRILAARDPANPNMITSTKPEYRERVEKYVDALQKHGPRSEAGDRYAWFEVAKPEENNVTQNPEYVLGVYRGTRYVLAHNTPDMGLLSDHTWALRKAKPGRDAAGRPAVDFELDARGGDKLAKLTQDNINTRLCIFLDKQAISAATIRSTISTRGQISGKFTSQEVAYLVNKLAAGRGRDQPTSMPAQERNN